MAKTKSVIKEIFEGEGLLSLSEDEIVLEAGDDGNVSLTKILEKNDGKFVKITITATDEQEVPLVDN